MRFLPETLSQVLDHSVRTYPKRVAFSFVDGSSAYTYEAMGRTVDELSELMSRHGVGAADKVVILSENMPSWGVAFFAVTAKGRVVVPILPDCSANEVNNIIAHSEAVAAFVSPKQVDKLSQDNLSQLKLVMNLATLKVVAPAPSSDVANPSPAATNSSPAADAAFAETIVPDRDMLAAILYTSGTSGNAKGVMLTHGNLCHNLVIAPEVHDAVPDDIWLSFLPMAHTYELSLALLYPVYSGSRVYYLDKAPTPTVILNAITKVRPTLICSVPLIIEKIYRKSVLPTIRKSKFLTALFRIAPGLGHRLVGAKLKKTFGGNLKVFAVGGAKLDKEVEEFLARAGFPYAIGYGLTETAPLICAAAVGKTKVGSTGWVLPGEQLKLLDVDPQTGYGELCVKGPNVMSGYYKDPERTAEAFTADGWFRTKDLACIDDTGRVSIVGRIGNMIVGASGENIYPEEIEMVINGMDGVEESIVKSDNGRLVALVKMADEVLRKKAAAVLQADEKFKAAMLRKINSRINKASQLSALKFVEEAFEKTATRKIRRFKY